MRSTAIPASHLITSSLWLTIIVVVVACSGANGSGAGAADSGTSVEDVDATTTTPADASDSNEPDASSTAGPDAATIDGGATGITPIFYRSVDDSSTGLYSSDDCKAEWLTTWENGVEEGRVSIIEDEHIGVTGKALAVLYPEGGIKSGTSGAQWKSDLGGEYDELYLSYWIKFREDFNYTFGGKLPGLGGSISWADRDKTWTGRLMWREEAKVEFYMHFAGGTRFWWDYGGVQRRFIPGQWHHVELHYRLNTPGEPDGIMEGWFDGELACEIHDALFRAAGDADVNINTFFFSTFFGGSGEDWAAQKDEVAYFDEVIVATERIGYPGPQE